MSDLLLITLTQPGTSPVPPQAGSPVAYFGEQSNDIQLDSVNDFATVSGSSKLVQEINKILLTERGDNTNFPLYGTIIQSLIGNKITNFPYVEAKVKDEVISALQILQFTNQNNPNQDEIPNILEFLSVTQTAVDTIEIQLSVITASGITISTGVVISA